MKSHIEVSKHIENENFDLGTIFEEIKEYFLLLLNHSSYITKIEKDEISKDDIHEYINDILGFSKFTDEEFKSLILPAMKLIINEKIDVCKGLYSLSEIQDDTIKIITLYILLERESKASSIYKSIKNSKSASKPSRIITAFHNFYFFKDLLKKIQPHLPPIYEKLSMFLNIKEVVIEKNNRFYLYIVTFDWERLIRDFENIRNETLNINNNKCTDINREKEKAAKILESGRVSNLTLYNFVNAIKLIRERIPKKKYVEINFLDIANKIRDDVKSFIEINPIMVTAYVLLGFIKDSIDIDKEIIAEYRKTTERIEDKLIKLEKTYQSVVNRIKNNIEDQEKDQLSAIASEIEQIKNEWPSQCPTTIIKLGQIEKSYNEIKYKIKLAMSLLFNLEKKFINRYNELKNESETFKQESVQNEEQIREPNLEHIEEKNKFAEEQQEKIKNYKDEVAKNRKDKEKQKYSRLLSSSSFINSVDNDDKDKTVIYKNSEIDALLKKLSSNNLKLLKAILAHERGITFNQVCNLITNHLGGSVSEIGNGSAHKRIELQKYTMKIIGSPGIAGKLINY
jgi:hypothetical protein